MTTASARRAPIQLLDLTLKNGPILRALRGDTCPRNFAALGRAAGGRDKSNVQKSIKLMQAAGLLDGFVLTTAGREQLAALDRAEGGDAGGLPPGYAYAVHADIRPSKLNPRKTFLPQEVEELAASIARKGLLENLVVRPAPDGRGFELAAGEKRWRAIARLIEQATPSPAHPEALAWPPGRVMIVQVRDLDDAGLLDIALEENYRRSNPNHLEIGAAFAQLMALEGITAKELAERRGEAPTTVQQHVRAHHEARPADRAAYLAGYASRAAGNPLQPGEITWDELRRRVQNPGPPPIQELELAPWQTLLLAEIAHAGVWLKDRVTSSHVEIDAAANSFNFGALVEKRLIYAPWRDQHGRWQVQAAYEGCRWLSANLPELGQSDRRHKALKALQDKLAGSNDSFHTGFVSAVTRDIDGRVYCCNFLDGPFEITEEDRAAVEAIGAENAERAGQAAQRRREAEALQARARDVFERVRGRRPGKPLDPVIPELLAAQHAPTPWALAELGGMLRVVDAVGEAVDLYALPPELLALAMNTLAGAATPPLLAEDDLDDEEEAPSAHPDAEVPAYLKRLAGAGGR